MPGLPREVLEPGRAPPPLSARTGGGAFGALHQRFQTGDPFSQRADVRAKVIPQLAYLLLDISPEIADFPMEVGA